MTNLFINNWRDILSLFNDRRCQTENIKMKCHLNKVPYVKGVVYHIMAR